MTITINPARKAEGYYKLLFRIRLGRAGTYFYKSDIEASVEEMKDFDKNGNPVRKFGRFNHELRDAIESEMEFIYNAYETLVENKVPISNEALTETIYKAKHSEKFDPYKGNLLSAYEYYIKERSEGGFIVEGTKKHYNTILKSLKRYLKIKDKQDILVNEFTPQDTVAFHDFFIDEYKYVAKHPYLYEGCDKREKPSKARAQNTVASNFKKLNVFFKDMQIRGYIDYSPVDRVGKDTLRTFTREQYDAPVYLHADEFQKVMATEVPASLQQCKDLFLFHCNLGCRIGDLQGFCRDRVCVTPDGIPYFRYIAHKTLKKVREDIETPLMLYALEIAKRYNFNFPLLNYAYGKSGYNVKIQELLKYCGIDRPCKVFNEDTEQNEFKPLYELASSKLCRKTHEDIMVKVQINFYTTGLHRIGSEAVKAYTQLELKDRFRMMCLAFGQPYFECDQNLNITKKEDNQ